MTRWCEMSSPCSNFSREMRMDLENSIFSRRESTACHAVLTASYAAVQSAYGEERTLSLIVAVGRSLVNVAESPRGFANIIPHCGARGTSRPGSQRTQGFDEKQAMTNGKHVAALWRVFVDQPVFLETQLADILAPDFPDFMARKGEVSKLKRGVDKAIFKLPCRLLVLRQLGVPRVRYAEQNSAELNEWCAK